MSCTFRLRKFIIIAGCFSLLVCSSFAGMANANAISSIKDSSANKFLYIPSTREELSREIFKLQHSDNVQPQVLESQTGQELLTQLKIEMKTLTDVYARLEAGRTKDIGQIKSLSNQANELRLQLRGANTGPLPGSGQDDLAIRQSLTDLENEEVAIRNRIEMQPQMEEWLNLRIRHIKRRIYEVELAMQRLRQVEITQSDTMQSESTKNNPVWGKELEQKIDAVLRLRSGYKSHFHEATRLRQRSDEIKTQHENLVAKHKKVVQRIGLSGLSPAVMVFLQQYQRELNYILLQRSGVSEKDITDLQVEVLDWEEKYSELLQESYVSKSASLEQVSTEQNLREQLLLVTKSLLRDLNEHLEAVIDLNFNSEALRKNALIYQGFIRDSILWTPSHGGIFASEFTGIQPSLGKALSRTLNMDHSLPADIISKLIGNIFIFILLVLFSRAWFKHISGVKPLPLFFQVLSLLIMALVWYISMNSLLGGLESHIEEPWCLSLHHFFESARYHLLAFLMLMLSFSHKSWLWSLYPNARQLHRRLSWQVFVAGIIFLCLWSAHLWLMDDTHGSSLHSMGRVLYAIILLGLAYGCAQLQRIILRNRKCYPDDNYAGLVKALKYLSWFSCFVPGVLVLMSMLGFHHTALILEQKYWMSICMFLLWVPFTGFLYHTMIFLRKEALIDARESSVREISEKPVSNYKRLLVANQQLRQIFQLLGWFALLGGIWWIWSDAFAALSFMKNFTLWTTTKEWTIPVLSVDGKTVLETSQHLIQVTVLDVFFVCFIIYVAQLISRNLHATLESYVFIPLDVGVGNRYATSTIIKYGFLLICTTFCFHLLGFSWSQIQWLAAAFSVGLGFGIQEIFANFISGIILLVERPVRVGDVISIDTFWGKIEKINIRSTTITNWDRQEVIVPNKELITGRLINWTLSNRIIRVIIKAGIAYGADVRRAKQIMLECAKNNPKVSDEPEAMVALMDFGDSSLNLEMDIYINDFKTEDDLDEVRDEINMDIYQRFREEGIGIPFPQRDLHIKSLPTDWNKPMA